MNEENYTNTTLLSDSEKKGLNILINSINDWPEDVMDLLDFENKVEDFLKENPSKESIIRRLQKIDYTIESWQAESLYQTLELYKYFEDSLTLKEIIKTLETKIKLCNGSSEDKVH